MQKDETGRFVSMEQMDRLLLALPKQQLTEKRGSRKWAQLYDAVLVTSEKKIRKGKIAEKTKKVKDEIWSIYNLTFWAPANAW